jgi:protoheme IX farnesyltransferase
MSNARSQATLERQMQLSGHLSVADAARLSTLKRLGWLAALLSLLVLISGQVARVSNASLACDDWPLCYGRVLPVAGSDVWIAFLHRALSALAGGAIALLAVLSVLWRAAPGARRAALAAVALTAAQVLIGAVVVRTQLEPLSRAMHLIVGLAVFGCVVALPLAVQPALDLSAENRASRRMRRAFTVLAALVFVLLISGSLVSGLGAALACGVTWPLCNGALLPNGGNLVFWNWAHRTVSVLMVLHVVSLLWRVHKPGVAVAPMIQRGLLVLLAGFGLQTALGVGLLVLRRPAPLSTAHNAIGALTWAVAVVLALQAQRVAMVVPEPVLKQAQGWRLVLSDYVALTKPKVVSLLLFTTLATMFVTPRGAPPWYLVVWTAIAGYLMVGAANAYNMWFDRDIDIKMGRTSLRPIPSGRISARQALVFSAVMLVASLLLYVLFVNVLAAAMALIGFFYYTVIYTSWLKRSTWQNIVIGGGAGAIPPLIGWAAATGSMAWGALLLFLVIFYWTPPHFWALAIMKKKDYASAGVPMLPVVSTDEETTRQMLIYSAGMVAISLALTPLGVMGMFYLIAAAILGGIFMVYAWRALRKRVPKTIWGMYGYSLLYLALLFAAMMVDRLAFTA